MFDMNSEHRIPRTNPLAGHGKHQPLWCEATWLFDFVGRKAVPSREGALRALLICQVLQFYDYGFELACYFRDAGLIESSTVDSLQDPDQWIA